LPAASRLLAVALVVGAFAARASAQTASASPDVAGFRTFAAWPDDAQVLAPGSAVISVAASAWRWAFGSGVGFPALYGSVGIAPRVQVSATFERDASSYTDGTHTASIGDRYIIGKIALIDPDTARIGLAVSPMVQILGDESLTYYRYYQSSDTNRVQFALPLHLQVPMGAARVSASAGIFSIGSMFASGAIEAPVNSRLVVNGSITHAFSNETSILDTSSVTSRHRTDASAGAWIVLSPSAFVFGSIGRTISRTDQNSMTLSANVGVAVFLGQK
jgi:hypothetical protein